jgi:hypothetical protein
MLRPRYTWEKNPGTHLLWGWVGLRAGLDVLEKRKISFHCLDSNSGLSSPKPKHYIDPHVITDKFYFCMKQNTVYKVIKYNLAFTEHFKRRRCKHFDPQKVILRVTNGYISSTSALCVTTSTIRDPYISMQLV